METIFVNDVLQMIGVLILTIVVIFGLLFVLKSLQYRSIAFNKYPSMRMIHTLHLAPKRSVALVEIAGKWLVLGVGTESVTLLTELAPPPESEDSVETQQPERKGFLNMLRDRLPGNSGNP